MTTDEDPPKPTLEGPAYDRAFRRLCHLAALSRDSKTREALEELVLTTLCLDASVEPIPGAVRDSGWRSSEREREATAIERDADRVCASFLLTRELFESGWKRRFEGEISGVIGAGAFVRFGGELGDAYEALLPVRLMRDDRFDLNQTETALVGRRSGRALRRGDPIDVRVDSVDAPRGRVDLVPAQRGDNG